MNGAIETEVRAAEEIFAIAKLASGVDAPRISKCGILPPRDRGKADNATG